LPQILLDGKPVQLEAEYNIRLQVYVDLWDDTIHPGMEAVAFEYVSGSGVWDSGAWDTTEWDQTISAFFADFVARLELAQQPVFDDLTAQLTDTQSMPSFDDVVAHMKEQPVPDFLDTIQNRMATMQINTMQTGVWDTGTWDNNTWDLPFSIIFETLKLRLEQAGE